MININDILRCLPNRIVRKIDEYFISNSININFLEEIRIRVNKPIIIKIGQVENLIECKPTTDDILEILQQLCDNSIYSFQNQICNGYITLKGGHRVGIAGNAVVKEGRVINISHISSLNFRIAKQVIGASDKIIKYILDIENNSIFNTLIVSPPGVGKTTLLRDLARRISNGIENINFHGLNISIVDERGEIAAMYRGIPQNDVGIRTDILDGINKAKAMTMLIRSMNPKVIMADEIGSDDDIDAIQYAICCGIKGIFTAHGKSIKDIKLNPSLNKLIDNYSFERIILLSDKQEKCGVDKIYYLNKEDKHYNIMKTNNYIKF